MPLFSLSVSLRASLSPSAGLVCRLNFKLICLSPHSVHGKRASAQRLNICNHLFYESFMYCIHIMTQEQLCNTTAHGVHTSRLLLHLHLHKLRDKYTCGRATYMTKSWDCVYTAKAWLAYVEWGVACCQGGPC